MSKFEFNDYIIAIDEPYENDYGYVAIGKKQSNGINIVFGSPNEKTVNWFIELQKYITNLQSQLDQAKSEITKYKILLNDMETENSHLETMLNQANERLKYAIIPKFKIGQRVWYISQNNDNVYEFMIKEMVFTRCKDEREMIVYYDEYCAQMYEYELYSSKEEAEKKLQKLKNDTFQGE